MATALFTDSSFKYIFLFVDVSDFPRIRCLCKDSDKMFSNDFFMRYWVITMNQRIFKDMKRDYELDIMRFNFRLLINRRKKLRLHRGDSFNAQLDTRIFIMIRLMIEKQKSYRKRREILKNRMNDITKYYRSRIKECQEQYQTHMDQFDFWHGMTMFSNSCELEALKSIREQKEDGYLESLSRKVTELEERGTKASSLKAKSIRRLIGRFHTLFSSEKK